MQHGQCNGSQSAWESNNDVVDRCHRFPDQIHTLVDNHCKATGGSRQIDHELMEKMHLLHDNGREKEGSRGLYLAWNL